MSQFLVGIILDDNTSSHTKNFRNCLRDTGVIKSISENMMIIPFIRK